VLVTAAALVAVVLGVFASIDRGRLLFWDRPITETVVDLRSPSLDRLARWVSRSGSTPVVLTAGVAGIALAARRSRAVAIVMFVVVATRPPFEWLVKEIVARPRPSGARLVAGTGFAYPSGHVLAAAATWGFVPAIAGLYLKRRWVWWCLTAAAFTVIGLVAWCRVWLGVHWPSDVIGGLAIAVVALWTAHTAIDRIQRRNPEGPDYSDARSNQVARAPGARNGTVRHRRRPADPRRRTGPRGRLNTVSGSLAHICGLVALPLLIMFGGVYLIGIAANLPTGLEWRWLVLLVPLIVLAVGFSSTWIAASMTRYTSSYAHRRPPQKAARRARCTCDPSSRSIDSLLEPRPSSASLGSSWPIGSDHWSR
jgi:membrane-associated phospholipid phosphatase